PDALPSCRRLIAPDRSERLRRGAVGIAVAFGVPAARPLCIGVGGGVVAGLHALGIAVLRTDGPAATPGAAAVPTTRVPLLVVLLATRIPLCAIRRPGLCVMARVLVDVVVRDLTGPNVGLEWEGRLDVPGVVVVGAQHQVLFSSR